MYINRVNDNRSPIVRDLNTMRTQMADLQRQLGTGVKAETYGQLGRDRSVVVALHARREAVSAFQQTTSLISTRLKVADTALTGISTTMSQLRSTINPNDYTLLSDGQTSHQSHASQAMEEVLSMLNTDVAGRYVFGGKNLEEAPVIGSSAIMNGEGTKAGLLTVVDQRRQADLGADGRGRLTVVNAGAAVTLAEDGSHPFGFKLSTATSSTAAVTVSGPSGSPPSLSATVATQPNLGDTLAVELALPDGTKTLVTLTFTDGTGATTNGVVLGADATATAANLTTALGTALEKAGQTSLESASAIKAARGFFDTFQGKPPERVAGPPYATATAVRDGSDDTVAWYRGDQTATDPRHDATARVDNGVTVKYGVRANEAPFVELMANLGAMVASDFSGGSEIDKDHSMDFASRLRSNIALTSTSKSVASIQVELASAAKTTKTIETRLKSTKATVDELIDEKEGVDKNEVAVMLLELQTRMQASYQATSIMANLNLTDYL
ncbi:MAG: hypothetical protein JNM13_12665 [Hyphomicrobiaceae bacterium]|nr:hypothetical protein [Hyphomicrobiaceae bacterium]